MAPYTDKKAPRSIPAPIADLSEIGVERWQYDLWHQIIRGALDGHPDQIGLDYHPKLNLPAASRYGASTPSLLGWFNRHNEDRPYNDQVRPSNFLLAFQINAAAIYRYPIFLASLTDSGSSKAKAIVLPKPVAPYDSDPANAAENCFDRVTGMIIPAKVLKTYKEALAQYHLRPENKFLNGNHTDRGLTKRRKVCAIDVRYIGKESNRWEERYYLGANDDANIDYRPAVPGPKPLFDALRDRIATLGQRKVARESGVARRTIERLMRGEQVRDSTIVRISQLLDRRR